MATPGVTSTRARAMAARLAETAERMAVDRPGRDLIAAAFDLAMEPRLRAALDDHAPDFLHPARTALIAMDDAGVAHAPTLAAALLVETRDAALRPDAGGLGALGVPGDEVAALVAAVPDPDEGEELVERLVTAAAPVLLIALVERLDHARHLHLRPRPEWGPYHATTCAAYAPLAGRADPVLERRFAWWCRTFRARFLGRA